MKIKQEEITKKIEEQDYLQDLETIKYSEITKTKLKNIATKMINEEVRELIKTYCGLYREVDFVDVKQIDRTKTNTIMHSRYIS